ncbi:MAG: DMT family transporter [Cyanobacteria bacterium SBLK]|nr:DMT family transporter [Cyanobacteria bacterium SBLK]
MKISEVLELFLLAALWGGSFLFLRMASPAIGPVWLIEFRVLIAGLVLLPFLIRLPLAEELRHHWQSLAIVGLLNSALPFVLLAFASLSLPAGFTSILNATAPLFGTAIAMFWLKEKFSSSRLLGLLLGFIGVVVLVGWQFSTTPTFLASVAAGLTAALMYAIAAPYIKQKLSEVNSLTIATGSQLGAAIVLLPLLPFTIPQKFPQPTIVLAILALAVFSTAFAYILYFRLIHHVGSTRALTVAYLIPVFAMLWGAIVLSEPITLAMILGCGCVLLGTAIANGVFSRFFR